MKLSGLAGLVCARYDIEDKNKCIYKYFSSTYRGVDHQFYDVSNLWHFLIIEQVYIYLSLNAIMMTNLLVESLYVDCGTIIGDTRHYWGGHVV